MNSQPGFNPPGSRRVLVIGLDGGTLDLIEPWAQEGHLPTMAHLIKNGVVGRLRSTVPTISPPAWTSFMTGKNPGKHGIFDFVHRAPNSYRLESVRLGQRRARSIFGILSDAGKRVGVINVPLTFPPEDVNGFMIAGLGAPDSSIYAYPPELWQALKRRGYRVNKRIYFRPGQEEAFLDDLVTLSQERVQVALEQLAAERWDLFMLVFRNVDEVQGFMWRYMDKTHPLYDPQDAEKHGDAILSYLKRVDGWIGELTEAMGDDATVMVMSDHGEGPLYKDVYLNNWLKEQGWLVLKKQPRFSLSTLFKRLGVTRETMDELIGWSNVNRLKKILPRRVWQNAPTRYPTLDQSVDWSRTKAYSFGYIGQIYVNLRGREPEGIVEPGAERDRLVAEIKSRLGELCDPEDGKPVVDAALASEEIYQGPYVDNAPDINVIMRDLSYITHIGRELGSEQIFQPVSTHESATHRLHGMMILHGADIRSGESVDQARIIDLAPTILHTMGLPVPTDMDGRVLTEAFTPAFAASHPVTWCEPESGSQAQAYPWSEEEERELQERLKGLGYIA